MFNKFLFSVPYELKLLLGQLSLVLLAMICSSKIFFYFSSCSFKHKDNSKL